MQICTVSLFYPEPPGGGPLGESVGRHGPGRLVQVAAGQVPVQDVAQRVDVIAEDFVPGLDAGLSQARSRCRPSMIWSLQTLMGSRSPCWRMLSTSRANSPGVNGLKIRARGLMEKLSGFSMVCSPSFIGSIDCEPTAGRQDFSSGASWFGGGISHQVAFICRFRGGAVLVRPPVP